MKPIGITIFEGPSLYGPGPLLRLTLEPESLPALSPESLRRRIEARLPESDGWAPVTAALEPLAKDAAAGGAPAEPGDLLAALSCCLQPRRFTPPPEVRRRPGGEPGKILLLIDCEDPDVGELVGLTACRIARQVLAPAAPEKPAELSRAMAEFLRRREAEGFGDNFRLLLAAARARGVPVRKLVRGRRMALFGQGKRRVRMGQNAGDRTSAFASQMSNDKLRTSRVLARAGIPVPRQVFIPETAEEGDIEKAIVDVGFPLVVKGRTGSRGHSVTAGIVSAEEVPAALAKARRLARRVVIEAHIEGDDHRLTVVGDKLVAAIRRQPAHVVGDGEQTVASLIAAENRRRRALGGYALWLVPLAIDTETHRMLTRQGLSPEDVPPPGQAVQLRSTANVSQGGVPEDVTERVHPETAALAERAARTVGLDIAGVDVLTTDISRPLTETGGAIIEVNHFPSTGVHYATETPPRKVGLDIIDSLFPVPHRGRIPLAAVTGTNGKTTTCRMLARILEVAGYCTAQVTTAGAYVGAERVLKGDYANAVGAHAVLQDTRVEAAVLETARGGIIRKGLGWDRCDVAAVTNIAEDHLHQDGIETLEQLAEVKGLILDYAAGAAVLNADDPFCRRMAARAKAPVWWTSCAQPVPNLVADHLSAGGNALLLEGEGAEARILHVAGEARREVARLSEVPASLDGLARHNIENALTAAASALAMSIPMERVRQGLAAFTTDFEDSPGRLNIRDVGGARIVLDHAHNPHGMAQIAATLTAMPASGLRRLLFMASTRQEEEGIANLAASAAPHFERFVVSEAFRPRVQRPVGEVSHLLRDGLMAAGVDETAITVELDENKAVARALSQLAPGDILLMLVDKYDAAWKEIEALEL